MDQKHILNNIHPSITFENGKIIEICKRCNAVINDNITEEQLFKHDVKLLCNKCLEDLICLFL